MNLKVYVNTSTGRRIVDAELIKENPRSVIVRIPHMEKHARHFLQKGFSIIKRKKGRDIVDEGIIGSINNKNENRVRLYSPKIINSGNM
jgi:hypothetical protein